MSTRSESEVPGLDLAEFRSWQNFWVATNRLNFLLNRKMVASHSISLTDFHVLQQLLRSANGSCRMGDIATSLLASRSRITHQVRRLEEQGLVKRGSMPQDRRAVLAALTEQGRALGEAAMRTYSECVREHYLMRLTRPQQAAIAESFRRVGEGAEEALHDAEGRGGE